MGTDPLDLTFGRQVDDHRIGDPETPDARLAQDDAAPAIADGLGPA